MKRLSLSILFLLATAFTYANSLKVINNTGCKYWISTDGGWFDIDPYETVAWSSPYDIGTAPPYDGDFHVVKVAVSPTIEVIDVTESGPFTNTSTMSYPCNGGAPFTITWTWSGPDVVVTID